MGQNPTEEEIFQMISQVDDDNSGEIEFAEFLKVIENQKDSAAKANDETDTIEAFVALGGNGDKTGEISTDKLRAVTKVLVILKTVGPTDLNALLLSLQDFGLTIDIEKLIRETDTDGSGKVDYAEFKEMMA
jgi:calmodulin|tara:strand:- start:117 stop:512 length:396 start_codon:yes stop_codon:yes gene_type:complete